MKSIGLNLPSLDLHLSPEFICDSVSREIHFYGNKGTPANSGGMAWWMGRKMVKKTKQNTHWSALFVYCDIFKSYLHMFSG